MEAIEMQSKSGAQGLEISSMVRSWANTNPDTQGIASVQLRFIEDELRLTIHGAMQNAPFHWGEVAVEAIYAENKSSRHGMSFVARYQFGFLDTLIQGNVNAGLLVLGAFHTFHDGSRRSNYFSREFFHEVAQ